LLDRQGSIGNSQYLPSPRLVGWGYSTGSTTVGPRIPPVSPVSQDLEPAYIAGNTGSASTDPMIRDYGCGDASTSCDGTNASLCNSRSSSTMFIVADREYYKQVSPAEQVSNSNSFNGTTGTGYGTLANRPTTCERCQYPMYGDCAWKPGGRRDKAWRRSNLSDLAFAMQVHPRGGVPLAPERTGGTSITPKRRAVLAGRANEMRSAYRQSTAPTDGSARKETPRDPSRGQPRRIRAANPR
jgi:hypothetical protein